MEQIRKMRRMRLAMKEERSKLPLRSSAEAYAQMDRMMGLPKAKKPDTNGDCSKARPLKSGSS